MYKIIVFLCSGAFASAGIAFFTNVIVIRTLSVEEYGMFSASIALLVSIAPFAIFGVPNLIMNEYGESKDRGLNSLKQLLLLCFLANITILILGLFILSNVLPSEELLFTSLLFSLLFAQSGHEIVSALLQVNDKFKMLSWWQAALNITRFAVLILVVFCIDKILLEHIYISYFIASLIIFVISIALIAKFIRQSVNFKVKSVQLNSPIKNGLTYAFAAFFFLIYYQSDIVFLRYLVGPDVAGLYSAAFTILAGLYLIPSVIFQKLFLPKVYKWIHNSKEKVLDIYKKGTLCMILLSIVTLVIVYLLAEYIIFILFGSRYEEAAEILLFLSLNIPLTYISCVSGMILMTDGNIRTKTFIMFLAACLNIALNALLIPIYSYHGAIAATFLSNLVIFFLYQIKVKDYLRGVDFVK